MNNVNREQEIELRDMLFNLLSKWKLIILGGIVIALLLGGFKFYKVEKNRKRLLNDNSIITEIESEVSQEELLELDKYQFEIYCKQISEIDKQITDKEYYLNNSILWKNDGNFYVARKIYHISNESDNFENPRDSIDPILYAFTQTAIIEPEFLSIAENMHLDYRLVKEIISISADINSNTLYVKAIGSDSTMAKKLLDEACKYVEAKKPELEKLYGAFTMTLVEESCAEEFSFDYLAKRYTIYDEITVLNKKRTDISNVMKTLEDSIKAKEEELAKADTIVAGTVAVPSFKSSIKTLIKWGIIGLIVGCILVAGVYAVIYIFNPVLKVSDDIRLMYGLSVLTVLNKKAPKHACFIDKWLMKLENPGPQTSDEELIKNAAISIENMVEKDSVVALITSAKESTRFAKLATMIDELTPDINVVMLSEGISKSENVEALSKCDAVVIAEERGVSSITRIDEEVEKIQLFNKKILGTIVM